MTRTLAAALAAILILSGAAFAEPKAVLVTRVEGAVQIVRAAGGASEKAGPMKVLYVGDRLQVPAGGKVGVVVYSDGHRETAAGPGTLTVSAAGLQGGKVERAAASRALAGLQSQAPVGGARAAVTTRPKDPDLPLRDLHMATDAVIERGRPVIGLPVVVGDGGLQYLTLRSRKGEIHREKRTMGTRYWIPPTALEPDDYEVRIEEEGGNVLARRIFTVVATDAGVDRLLREPALSDPDTEAEVFMAASQFLEEQGHLESALEAAEVALSKQPSPELLRWTADLAERLGRLTEAAAWDRLAEMMETSPSK